jgi:hypothetical protein
VKLLYILNKFFKKFLYVLNKFLCFSMWNCSILNVVECPHMAQHITALLATCLVSSNWELYFSISRITLIMFTIYNYVYHMFTWLSQVYNFEIGNIGGHCLQIVYSRYYVCIPAIMFPRFICYIACVRLVPSRH